MRGVAGLNVFKVCIVWEVGKDNDYIKSVKLIF